jgi:hypothetical protein
MAEQYYVRVSFGGKISKKLLQALIEKSNDILEESPDFEDVIKTKGTIYMNGWAFLDETEELESMLQQYDLTYHFTIDPKDDCEGTLFYHAPGHKGQTQSDINGHPVIRIKEIKPYVDFMTEYIKDGKDVLPLYATQGDNDMRKLILDLINNPDDALKLFEEKFRKLLPLIPDVPPIEIIEEE